MNVEKIAVENYEFELAQFESHVSATVKLLSGEKFSGEELEKLKTFLGSIGKWEMLVEISSNFLRDVGLFEKCEDVTKMEHGCGKYDIVYHYENGYSVIVNFILKPHERLVRGKNQASDVLLPIEEIASKIKNIPKWRCLEKLISNVGSVFQCTK